MKNRIMKVLTLLIIVTSVLGVTGFSYAYFNTEIIGKGKNIVLETGEAKLIYTDLDVLSLSDALPGESITKTFEVKNNTSKTFNYNIIWNNLINKISDYDLHIDMKCISYDINYNESGTCDSFYKAIPYSEEVTSKSIRNDIEIKGNTIQKYTITISFLNRTYNQNKNLNKKFSGRIDIEEYIDNSPTPIYCTYDGDLVQGTEYVNGQYTYRYKQIGYYSNSVAWMNTTDDGWGVQLTDRNSTEDVTSKLCTYINDKPVVSMTFMFFNSKASNIDVSSFNTSNVKNMSGMFYNTSEISINGLNTFNTKNVLHMSNMFNNSKATTLDLSNFDTRNVLYMDSMFQNSKVTNLDLTSFDTSKVTNMNRMFLNIKVSTLDLSNFNTSNVTDMSSMFQNSKVTNLDLSNFNTSKATNMSYMFYGSEISSLDLSSFNTSKVTNMSGMFQSNKSTNINLSNFNTSSVTDMSYMFASSYAPNLDLSNFDTSKVYSMSHMFNNSKATVININNFNTSKVTNMEGMFQSSNAILIDVSNFDTSSVTNMSYMFYSIKNNILDLSNFDTNKVKNMSYMFNNSTNLKTIYVTNKFNTDNVTSSTSMFNNCNSLVGGSGTKYSSSYIDKTYARIDTLSSPGYFTSK